MNNFFTYPAIMRIQLFIECAVTAVAPMQLNLETRVDFVPHSALRSDIAKSAMNAWQKIVAKSVLSTYLYFSVTNFFYMNGIIPTREDRTDASSEKLD